MPAIEEARLVELTLVIHCVKDLVGGARDATSGQHAASQQHLVENAATSPCLGRIKDEFATVLVSDDSSHVAILVRARHRARRSRQAIVCNGMSLATASASSCLRVRVNKKAAMPSRTEVVSIARMSEALTPAAAHSDAAK